MTFMNTMAGSINLGMPDVCNTPSPVGPVPVPYPNISSCQMCNPATVAQTVLVAGMFAVNVNSQILMSNGDNAGVAGGVASGMMMGPTRFLLGSTTVMTCGMPAQRLTSITGQNGMSPNCPGVTVVPAQTKVMVNR